MVDCPIGLSEPCCSTCVFVKEGLCDYPNGIGPDGKPFKMDERVICEQSFGEYTTRLIDEISNYDLSGIKKEVE